jgi:hypothetical protein
LINVSFNGFGNRRLDNQLLGVNLNCFPLDLDVVKTLDSIASFQGFGFGLPAGVIFLGCTGFWFLRAYWILIFQDGIGFWFLRA